VRRAALLRLKYRKQLALVRIPVEQIGFHPSNRDGHGPSAERCAGLLTDILKIGFDVVEADTNGVLVEQKPGTRSIAAFNERVCEGEPCLAPVMMGSSPLCLCRIAI